MADDRAGALGVPRRCTSVESVTYGTRYDRELGQVSKRARVQCYRDQGHPGQHAGAVAGTEHRWEDKP